MRCVIVSILAICTISCAFGQDLGIGVIFFKQNSPHANSMDDSMCIFSASNDYSKIIGTFSIKHRDNGYSYILHDDNYGMQTNFVEFRYEEEGLPIDSISSDTQWVRVIWGGESSRASLLGWVRNKSPHTDILLWKHVLLNNNVFFRYPEQVEFYSSPNGNKRIFTLEKFSGANNPRRYNYIMHPLRTDGDWMQVRVVTPSDYCDSPDNARSATLWIKYLDHDGRPLVWFYARGC
jgi:hypothetical protein